MDLSECYIRHWQSLHGSLNNEQLNLYNQFNANGNLEYDLFEFHGLDLAVMPHFPGYEIAEHHHNFYEFIYVYRGSCLTTIDSKLIQLNEGDLCLLNLKASHTIELIAPTSDVIFNILVKQAVLDNAYFKLISCNEFISDFFLDSMQNKRKDDNYVLFRREPPNCPYENLVQHIIYEFYEGFIYKDKMFNFLFITLMIELARSYGKHINKEIYKELKDRDISEIIQYIVDNCVSVSINSLAEYFNYSPNYISILIKKYSGSSFSDILHNVRFKKAAQMLTESLLPIVEIMDSVGYTNRTWFTKKFQDRYQLSPSEYRKKYGSK